MGVMHTWLHTLIFYYSWLNIMRAQAMHHFAFTDCMPLCLTSQAVVANQHTKMYVPSDMKSEPPSQTGEYVLLSSLY